MKKISFIIASAILLVSCAENNANEPVANATSTTAQTASIDESKLTTIEWIDSTQQNLGSVKEGQNPEITWRFKNTGDQPLVIENTSATCGCTVAEKPEQPVMPGEEGVIKARFNSTGRLGPNRKDVVVIANTKGSREQVLNFNVVVEATK